MVRQTSIESYSAIKNSGSLGQRQLEVYSHLYKHGPLTANQIFKGVKGYTVITQANIHARLNELKSFGVVYEVNKVYCDITGKKVLLFDVTDKTPVKPKRGLTNQKKINLLKKALLYALDDYKKTNQTNKHKHIMDILKEKDE